MSWDGGSGYRTYVFKESIKRCAINYKGQGRKEVIYLRVADVSCTQGVTYLTTHPPTPVIRHPKNPPKIGKIAP